MNKEKKIFINFKRDVFGNSDALFKLINQFNFIRI